MRLKILFNFLCELALSDTVLAQEVGTLFHHCQVEVEI